MRVLGIICLAVLGPLNSCNNAPEESDLNIIPKDQADQYLEEQKNIEALEKPLLTKLAQDVKSKDLISELKSQGYEYSYLAYDTVGHAPVPVSLGLVPIRPQDEDELLLEELLGPEQDLEPYQVNKKVIIAYFSKNGAGGLEEYQGSAVPVSVNYDLVPIQIEFDRSIEKPSDLKEAEIKSVTKLDGFEAVPV